jgi:hypothetical protein
MNFLILKFSINYCIWFSIKIEFRMIKQTIFKFLSNKYKIINFYEIYYNKKMSNNMAGWKLYNEMVDEAYELEEGEDIIEEKVLKN